MLLDISQLFQAVRAGIRTNVDSNEFLTRYKSRFPNVAVGCTYRPESIGNLEKNLEALSHLYTLGIKEVRLGLRWSEIETTKGKLDLSLYKLIIQDLLDHGCNLTLNIGPIKSAGWPEQFIPDWVYGECSIEKKQCVVPGDELAGRSMHFLNLLLSQLVEEFGNNFCTKIQPENECFKEFGTLELTASPEYLQQVIEIINTHLDNPEILLNSSGRRDLPAIMDFVEWSGLSNKFVAGYNYYFVFDSNSKFYPHIRYSDDYVRIEWDTPKLGQVMPNISYEVSEMQFEPWGDAWWPGNDFDAFAYGMWRCGQVSRGQNPFVVRLWGIEKLLKKMMKEELTAQHKEIISVLQRYNNIHFS